MTENLQISDAIEKAVNGEDLPPEESRQSFEHIMEGEATDAQISSLITALRMKGETGDEIRGAARSMREAAVTIEAEDQPVLDIVGTGGDNKNTFNVSTTSAIVAAGAGATVAKHGNRSVSSSSGSADVLETLGVEIETTPEQNEAILNEAGIAFLFATRHHPAMKHAIGPRKEIEIRTIFNILGPLTNPAGADRYLLGAYTPEVARKQARALTGMNIKRALVVHGSGFDEITPTDSTLVFHVEDGDINEFTIEPEDFGFDRCDESELAVEGPRDSADTIRGLLSGDIRDGRRHMVLLNAGFGLFAEGRSSTPKEGIDLARESIDSGEAMDALDRLVNTSQKHV